MENVSRETKGFMVTEAGVDFITATGKDEASYRRVFEWLAEYSDACVRAGQKAFRQYRNGFSLFSVGSASFGRRGPEWMVHLWGNLARTGYQKVAPTAHNITRVDLQATIRLDDYTGTEVTDAYALMGKATKEGKPVSRSLVVSEPGGRTLYVGRRQSQQMGRYYDKWLQSKKSDEFDKCVRFEVEYKKPLAKATCEWLLDENPDAEGIAGVVLGWFQDRGVDTQRFGVRREGAIQIPQVTLSPEQRLKWLERQVRPTYQQLVMAGFEMEANQALGIIPEDVNKWDLPF